MSDRVVPDWARWLLVLGILLPMVSYFWWADYTAATGFWGNAMIQDVSVPFLRGQNPIECFSESMRNITGSALGEAVNISFQCTKDTQIPYRYILLLSFVMFALGLYRHINPEQLANTWPTEWRVFDKNNAKPSDGPPPGSKYNPEKEEPIKPNEGGF